MNDTTPASSASSAPSAPLYVGIDVSKARLDVALSDRPDTRGFDNDGAGYAALVAFLKPLNPKMIVLEATGGYERDAAIALLVAGLPAAVVNPHQVRQLAKGLGRHAKTDRIDAHVLVRFGQVVNPRPTPLTDEMTLVFQENLGRRRQLTQMLTAERNRLQQARAAAVRQSIESVIDALAKQIKQIDNDLDGQVAHCPAWRDKEELLTQVPGVGNQTARTLLAALPELGSCSRQQIASLVGVAPVSHDSGTMKGRRAIAGGRPVVRTALYMATLVATRFNPTIQRHYQKLLAQGKMKKVALIACLRKLITILNAMLRTKSPWRKPATST